MWCSSRYNKECEEALKFNCDIPSNNINTLDEYTECTDCVFAEENNNDRK